MHIEATAYRLKESSAGSDPEPTTTSTPRAAACRLPAINPTWFQIYTLLKVCYVADIRHQGCSRRGRYGSAVKPHLCYLALASGLTEGPFGYVKNWLRSCVFCYHAYHHHLVCCLASPCCHPACPWHVLFALHAVPSQAQLVVTNMGLTTHTRQGGHGIDHGQSFLWAGR